MNLTTEQHGGPKTHVEWMHELL